MTLFNYFWKYSISRLLVFCEKYQAICLWQNCELEVNFNSLVSKINFTFSSLVVSPKNLQCLNTGPYNSSAHNSKVQSRISGCISEQQKLHCELTLCPSF